MSHLFIDVDMRAQLTWDCGGLREAEQVRWRYPFPVNLAIAAAVVASGAALLARLVQDPA